jgi:actin-related protein
LKANLCENPNPTIVVSPAIDHKYPINRGVLMDWENMEEMWHKIVDSKLHISSKDHPLLITRAPMNPKANGEKLVSLLFEKFSVRGIYVQLAPVLSLLSIAHTPGIDVE